MNTHITRRIAGALGVALFAVAALSSAPSVAQDKLKVRLILPTAVTTFMLPYLVPKDQGWYDENGLEVEEVFVAGDSTALRTLLAGDGDLTMIGPPTLFRADIEGAKAKSIGSWQPVVDYQIVAAKSVGTTLKDLAGKIFASAGPSDMTTEIPKMVLQKHGVDTSDIRFIQVGGHPARLQAVEAGKVQATMINILTSVKGQRDGAINVISAVTDDFPSLGYAMLVAKDSDLANPAKRRAYEIFLNGNIIGARYTMEHPDEAAAILDKRAPDMGLDLVKQVVKQLDDMKVWGVNGGNDADVIRFTSKVSKDLGMIDREVSVEEVMDNSLADKLLAELGRK